jgi:hypothetical protein
MQVGAQLRTFGHQNACNQRSRKKAGVKCAAAFCDSIIIVSGCNILTTLLRQTKKTPACICARNNLEWYEGGRVKSGSVYVAC